MVVLGVPQQERLKDVTAQQDKEIVAVMVIQHQAQVLQVVVLVPEPMGQMPLGWALRVTGGQVLIPRSQVLPSCTPAGVVAGSTTGLKAAPLPEMGAMVSANPEGML